MKKIDEMRFDDPVKQQKVLRSINFDEDVLKFLDEVSQKTGISVSYLVNDLCRQYKIQKSKNKGRTTK
jgi:metal-responsive CopG/Arc/MetJ family transcriptional regulator